MKQNFKKAVSLFLTVLMLMSAVPIFAFADTSGNYTYTVSNGYATITGVDSSISGDITIPSTLGGYPVTKIANSVFAGTAIESVVIPDTIESIGWYAFQGSDLKSVYFESEKRNLFIYTEAFADCVDLAEINLNSGALYGISTDAFNDSAFYLDESNWVNGALYINDVLLAVNIENMPKKYAIKDDTKVIADGLWPLVVVEPGEEYEGIDVIIPESVDNFGTFSLVYEADRENIFRAGRCVFGFFEDYNNRIIALQEAWTAEFGFDNSSKNIPLNALKALPEELLYPSIVTSGFMHAIQPWWIHSMWKDNTKIELYKFGDIKGFADDWSVNFAPTFSIVPTVCDGYILPESVELIGRFTPFSETNTNTSLYFYGGDEEELQENLKGEKSLTFFNAECRINDSADTIWHGYTICGYPESTAYDYAMKYNRKFVDISACTHPEKASKYAMEASCIREGYTGDVYCQYCGEFLEAGTTLTASENHTFGAWEIVSYPSCEKDGTRKHACELCGIEKTEIYQAASGHKYVENITPVTCKSAGKIITTCENCYFYEYETIPATGHVDENNDYICDVCGEQLTIDCGCNCHKDGFIGFFYKIISFFWRLFRINQVCGCGAYHY